MKHIRFSISGFIKNSGFENKIGEQRALGVWGSAVGEKIAQNTEAIGVRGGVISVQTKNATWRQELQLQKQQIIEKINKKLNKKIIKDIRFV